jgi:hypothetical protein
MTRLLLILHFTGLAMGFSATFAGMVVMRLIASSVPHEAEILRRILPQMTRISAWGVVLLLITGPMLVYWKFDGAWGAMPLSFWLKMAAVAGLVAAMGVLHVNMARARNGDLAAAARMEIAGPLTSVAAALALIFAVVAFG